MLDAAASGQDMVDLEVPATLSALVGLHRQEEQAAAEKMRAVCHWADLHHVGYVGAVLPDIAHDILRRDGVAGLDSHLGLEGELRLAGEGCFMVDEFAVAEVAAALGMSEAGARSYVGQSLELRERLPRLWEAVMRGDLASWKARKVAEETIPLKAAAAAYVDAQLAPFAHKVSAWRILKAVEAATLRFDPELAADRARAAADKRGVWVDDRLDGTSEVSAVTSSPDAHALDQALDEVAATLRALGDEDSQQVRRSKALAVLADPQYALDLASTAEVSGRPRPTRNGPTLHVHLHTDVVEGVTREAEAGHVARVAGLGARSLETVTQWLSETAPGARITVTPVVDLAEHISVDAYEAPDRLRRQVEARDDCCRFPWCGRTGRYDLDHIDSYVPLAEGGPPGQTNGTNLARLCRFHHRVKTFGGWRYQRERSGALTWISPLGRRYTVDETGTTPQA